MEYVGQDNARHRPIMIHRALFGSVERFFAILLEHYAGAFPTWLAPVQVRVLPVRDDHAPYAERGRERVSPRPKVRVEADDAGEPLGARIRRAKLEKLPYVLVVGDSRRRGGDRRGERTGLGRARARRAPRRVRRARCASRRPRPLGDARRRGAAAP